MAGGAAKLLLKQPVNPEWRRLMISLHPRQANVFGGAFWLNQNIDALGLGQEGFVLQVDFGYMAENYHQSDNPDRFKLLVSKGTTLPGTIEVRDLVMRRNDVSIQLAQRDPESEDKIQSLGEWPLGEIGENQPTVSLEITLLASFDGLWLIKTTALEQNLDRWQLIDLSQNENPLIPLAVRRWLED